MERVAIFVDVQNVYYTSRQTYRKNFDYNVFWRGATTNREVVAAFAYAIQRGDSKQQEFQNILRAIGFEVKLKPFIQRADGSAKGDWDVGITIDMMDLANQVDTLILVSGDGDFSILCERLTQKSQKNVEVYGVPALTASSLMQSATKFIPIDQALLMG